MSNDNRTTSTEQAAKESTARGLEEGRIIGSGERSLDERSVRAVWEFAQFPPNWEDPIGERFATAEKERLGAQYPGLMEYLEHKEKWSSAAGRLIPRAGGQAR